MDIAILPGNLKVNKPWVEGMVNALLKGNKIIDHEYSHWTSDQELLDIDLELKCLRKKLIGIKKYAIVAKSAGILVATKGIYKNVLKPNFCTFIGTPITWADEHNFPLSKWVKKLNVPVLFIQQKDDPFANSNLLKKFLKKNLINKYKVMTIEGGDHWYGEYGFLSTEIKKLIKNKYSLKQQK